MVRAYSTSAVTVQVFESKATVVLLLNSQVEGIETTATSGIPVLLTVLGV